MRGERWIPIGPGREVGLSPGPLREHPGTRSRATRAAGAGVGRGLHSNGLCFPDLAGPAGPGAGEGGGHSRSAGRRGQIAVPLGPGYQPQDLPTPSRRDQVLPPATPLRSGPAQANGGLPGLRGLGERPSPGLLEGQPAAVGFPACPSPAGAGQGGGVDRAVLTPRETETQVALSTQGPGRAPFPSVA